MWQVQVPVDVACMGASRETAVLDFSYTVGHTAVWTQPLILRMPGLEQLSRLS